MTKQTQAPKAILYVRVSTRGKNQEDSPETQKVRLIQYCEAMGYQWSKDLIFTDYFTGTSMDRPGWNKVMQAIEAGKGNLIVATRLDRLARTDEFPAFLRNVIKKHGADIACIEQKIDTTTSQGRMVLGIMSIIYQQFVEETREKTAAAMEFKLSEGFWPHPPPFGTCTGEVKGVPAKNQHTWPILIEMFEKSARGVCDAEILAWLNSSGIRTSRGCRWTQSSVSRCLSNRWYLGEYERDGSVYSLKHDCRLDRSLWDAAQLARQKPGRTGRRPSDYPYLLRGMVVCSHFTVTYPPKNAGQSVPLGSVFSYGRGGKKYHYYKLRHRLTQHGKMQAEPVDSLAEQVPDIPAQELDALVINKLISIIEHDKSGKLMLDTERAAEKANALLEAEIRALRQKIKEAEASQKRASSRLADAFIADDSNIARSMSTRMDELAESIERYQAELAGKTDALSILSDTEGEVGALVQRINLVAELYADQDWDALHSALKDIIDQVDVRLDGTRIRLRSLPSLRQALAVHDLGALAALTGIEPVFSP